VYHKGALLTDQFWKSGSEHAELLVTNFITVCVVPLRGREILTKAFSRLALGFLYRDPFHLVERDVIVCPIVELRCARGLMRRDCLGVLNSPAVLKIGRDPGRAERVATSRGGESGFERPAFHHPKYICARHWIRSESSPVINTPKQRRLLFLGGRAKPANEGRVKGSSALLVDVLIPFLSKTNITRNVLSWKGKWLPPPAFLPLCLPDRSCLTLEDMSRQGDVIMMTVSATSVGCACPRCGVHSSHIHSRYSRTLRDLPCHGAVVRICLRTHRFYCRAPDCPRRSSL